jgi:hypothetical protein
MVRPPGIFTPIVRVGSFDASGPAYAGSNAAHITTSSAGSNIQLFQYNISLNANTSYRLTFAAYSTSGRDISVSIQKHGSPYTNYGLSFQQVNLGSSWHRFYNSEL